MVPAWTSSRSGGSVGRWDRIAREEYALSPRTASRAIRAHLRSRGIKAVIPEPDDQKGHRRRRGSRGGRPVALDAADYKHRNVIERNYCRIKQWRGLATRYDKHAVTYRAAVVLNSVIAWVQQLSDTP